jgi:uncharacterized phage-like protein YoqJ
VFFKQQDKERAMANKNICIIIALLFTLFLATGCSTSIGIAVQRLPTLNTAGIKRIAIMPFEANSNSYREMAQYATSVAMDKIKAMNYFTLVASSEIERLQRTNQSLENYIDAQFVGRITRISIENETQKGSYKTKDGEIVNYTDYLTNVEIEFNYSLILARDGRLIGPVSKRKSLNSSSRESYPPSAPLLRSAIDDQLRLVGRDIAPYTVYESRVFASDKSKDKVLKQEMKDALALVKAGNYRTAFDAYLGIYEKYKSAAAAENVSILYESFGEVQTAADFMQRVYSETGNPRARDVLVRLNRIIQDRATIASEYGDNRNQTERISALASEEVRSVLPRNARVWIYNNTANNSLAVSVVDNLTSDFIRRGIGVVDRQNTRLVEAEQKYNMSGYVSDNDFLSIGNAVGANTIVIIGINGTGAARRLQVRVLDIEKNIPIMQSDASDKWQI